MSNSKRPIFLNKYTVYSVTNLRKMKAPFIMTILPETIQYTQNLYRCFCLEAGRANLRITNCVCNNNKKAYRTQDTTKKYNGNIKVFGQIKLFTLSPSESMFFIGVR